MDGPTAGTIRFSNHVPLHVQVVVGCKESLRPLIFLDLKASLVKLGVKLWLRLGAPTRRFPSFYRTLLVTPTPMRNGPCFRNFSMLVSARRLVRLLNFLLRKLLLRSELGCGWNECFFWLLRVFFCSACFSVFLLCVFSVLLYKTFIKLRFCFKLLFPPRSQGQASE